MMRLALLPLIALPLVGQSPGPQSSIDREKSPILWHLRNDPKPAPVSIKGKFDLESFDCPPPLLRGPIEKVDISTYVYYPDRLRWVPGL